jgi:hypothetical protein
VLITSHVTRHWAASASAIAINNAPTGRETIILEAPHRMQSLSVLNSFGPAYALILVRCILVHVAFRHYISAKSFVVVSFKQTTYLFLYLTHYFWYITNSEYVGLCVPLN